VAEIHWYEAHGIGKREFKLTLLHLSNKPCSQRFVLEQIATQRR